MKIAFDEEVSPDDVEAFRKLSTKYRSPTTVFMTFAFVGQVVPQPSAMLKPVEKNASLKYTYTHKIFCHNVHCILHNYYVNSFIDFVEILPRRLSWKLLERLG